jgi:hypothetical protein
VLTRTLEGWGRVHRAGSDGRFRILMEILTKPYQGEVDSGNLANAAWALSDKGHLAARRLGSLDPKETPPDADISWLRTASPRQGP